MKGLECKGYLKMLSNCASNLKADFKNNKRQCGKPFSNFLRSRLRAQILQTDHSFIIKLSSCIRLHVSPYT